MPSPLAERLRLSRPPAGLALAGGALAVLAILAIAFVVVARPFKQADTAGLKKRPGRAQAITGPPATPFELRYPAGWRKISKGEIQKEGGDATVAGIRRADGRGVVTVSVRGPLASPLDEMRESFANELAERFPDFELVTSTEVQVDAGTGMYTSWLRREEDRVQGNLTVPVGTRTYALDASLPTGATDVAREIGAILGSFTVRQPG
jgi:hypothetical protein